MANSPLLWGPNNTSNNLQNQIMLANGMLLNSNGSKNYITYNNFENGLLTGWTAGYIPSLTNGLPNTINNTPSNSGTFAVSNQTGAFSFTLSGSSIVYATDVYKDANNDLYTVAVDSFTSVSTLRTIGASTNNPPLSGTLTKVTGLGPASLTYTAVKTLTATIQPSSPLRNINAASLNATTTTAPGMAFLTNALTLDAADRGQVLTWKFNYSVVGGTTVNASGTASNTFAVAVYDVANTQWLGTAGQFNIVQTTGPGVCTGTLQVPINATQLIFAVYVVNPTTLGNGSLFIDDLYLGPQITSIAPAMSDWVSYAPTISGLGTGSATLVSAFYRRIGDSVQITATYTKDGSAGSGATIVTIALPSGLVAKNIAGETVVGPGEYNLITPTEVLAFSSVSTTAVYLRKSGANAAIVGADIVANATIKVNAIVPISGWSANTVSSADTDTRVVSARVYKNGNQVGLASGDNKIINMIVESDRAGMWDATNNRFNIPVSGDYRISMVTSLIAGTFTGDQAAGYRVNGGTTYFISGSTQENKKNGSSLITNLKAGDYVELIHYTATSGTLLGGQIFSFYTLDRISGPAVVQATESVNARYTVSVSQALGNGTSDIINFSTKDYDSHNAVTTGASWKFTAPVSGKYEVSAGTMINAFLAVPVSIALYKNGSSVGVLDYMQISGGAVKRVVGSTSVSLNAGDYIDVRINVGAAGQSTIGAAGFTFIAIDRVGN